MPADLTALIERVEEGTGLDRELDAIVCASFAPPVIFEHWMSVTDRRLDPALWTAGKDGYVMHPHWEWTHGPGKSQSPPYTISLDAVLALLERVLPGAPWRLETRDGPTKATVVVKRGFKAVGGEATTPARALLSATLRAVAAKEGAR